MTLASCRLLVAACLSALWSFAACSSGSASTASPQPSATSGDASTDSGRDAAREASSDAKSDAPDAFDASNADDASIAATKTLDELNEAERAQLCDWMNQELGGYGRMTNCPGGMSSVSNDPDQASCVATKLRYRCSITVSQFQACIQAEAPSFGCVLPAACRPLLC